MGKKSGGFKGSSVCVETFKASNMVERLVFFDRYQEFEKTFGPYIDAKFLKWIEAETTLLDGDDSGHKF